MDASGEACEAAAPLPETIAEFVVQLGQDRLKALQSSSAAIDQRITQIGGFQLTAAAFAGTILVNSASSPSSQILALTASASFIVGMALAIYAVSRGHQELPGMPPNWWVGDATSLGFRLVDARRWMAIHCQYAIDSNFSEDERRIRLMRMSLAAGAIGGLFLLLSAATRIVSQFADVEAKRPPTVRVMVISLPQAPLKQNQSLLPVG